MVESKSFNEIGASITVRLPDDLTIHVMDSNHEVAIIRTDWKNKLVYVEQFQASRFSMPFPLKGLGKFEVSTLEFIDYIKTRCFPDSRDNRDYVLRKLGLSGYNPYKIIQKTRGQQADDYIWFKFNDEEVDYGTVSIH